MYTLISRSVGVQIGLGLATLAADRMMHAHKKTTVLLSLLGLLAACSDSGPGDAPPAVTYQNSVRAIMETRCLACHLPGGVAPFALDDYDKVKAFAPAALAAMQSGRMPPWGPDPDCHRYEDERLLAPGELEAFQAWVAAGTPEGELADYTPPAQSQAQVVDLGAPTLQLEPSAAYVPDPSRPDDYRCLPLGPAFEQEMYLRTAHVLPDKKKLVHHVIVYLVAPQFAGLVESLDAEDSGPGYTCFGGAGAGQATPIAGWTPGDAPPRVPSNASIRIPKGARLVMQMHYNLLSSEPEPDNTQVQLWLQSTPPEFLLMPRFFPHLGLDIDVADPASKHTRRFINTSDRPWTIAATSPHMHLLGTRLRTVRENADGSETCLVDVPRWDFSWQQTYVLPPDQQMVVMPGQALRLECTYDNSEANQPVINGERQPARRVTWGEGTLDEMCLNSIVLVEPYAPLPEAQDVCSDFQPCYDQCMAGNTPRTGCILSCGGNTGCAGCVLPGLFGELAEECGVQANEVLTCLESCGLEADSTTCVSQRCGSSIVAFDICANPHVEAGDVTRPGQACGVDL